MVAAATVGRKPVASGVEEMMNRKKMPKTSELKLGICNADDIMKYHSGDHRMAPTISLAGGCTNWIEKSQNG